MEHGHRPAHRNVQLSRGSASIEGIVGLAVAFLLLTLLVQLATLLVARNAAVAATQAAARDAARPGANTSEASERLERAIRATVPGVERVRTRVAADGRLMRARTVLFWEPPGPGWGTIKLDIKTSAPIVVPP